MGILSADLLSLEADPVHTFTKRAPELLVPLCSLPSTGHCQSFHICQLMGKGHLPAFICLLGHPRVFF